MQESKTTPITPSPVDEAMAFVRQKYGHLSEKERNVALDAANISRRWTKREIAGKLSLEVMYD